MIDPVTLSAAIAAHFAVAVLPIPPISYLNDCGGPTIGGAYIRQWKDGQPAGGNIVLCSRADVVLAEELIHHYQHSYRLLSGAGYDNGDAVATPLASQIVGGQS
jgi:hypothetical protein